MVWRSARRAYRLPARTGAGLPRRVPGHRRSVPRSARRARALARPAILTPSGIHPSAERVLPLAYRHRIPDRGMVRRDALRRSARRRLGTVWLVAVLRRLGDPVGAL